MHFCYSLSEFGSLYGTNDKNESYNNDSDFRNCGLKEEHKYFDLDKLKEEQVFGRILLHEQNVTRQNTQRENVVERYQVILPPLEMLQERTLKQVPLNYAVPQPSRRVILTTNKMKDTANESSATSATTRKLHFRCKFCAERLATRNSLSTHVKSHRRPYCRLCLVVLKTDEQLRMHLNRVHPPKSPHRQVTVVTSKYGRRRKVFSTLSLMKRRNKKVKDLKQFRNN